MTKMVCRACLELLFHPLPALFSFLLKFPLIFLSFLLPFLSFFQSVSHMNISSNNMKWLSGYSLVNRLFSQKNGNKAGISNQTGVNVSSFLLPFLSFFQSVSQSFSSSLPGACHRKHIRNNRKQQVKKHIKLCERTGKTCSKCGT